MKKIQHLLNTNKQTFICLGGLPGAGKTTIANKFVEAGYELVSPDVERYELAKKDHGEDKFESQLQYVLGNYGNQAWKICEHKIEQFIKEGKSVIFDATLTTTKSRRKIKSWSERLKVGVSIVYLDVPLEEAIDRNDKRGRSAVANVNGGEIYGRTVPDFVIQEKFVNQTLPLKEEGFKEIVILSHLTKDRTNIKINSIVDSLIENLRDTINQLKQSNTLKDIFPDLDKSWGIEQDNKHHTQTLEEHMIKAAEIIIETYKDQVSGEELRCLMLSTLNHDIGKKDTKEFYGIMQENYDELEKNEKVIIKGKNEFGVIIRRQFFKGFYETIVPYDAIKFDPNAHFYGHDNVGATQIRRNLLELGFNEDFSNEVYALVLHHMKLPYQPTSNKSMNKLIRTVGHQRMENLLRIRYADKNSSATQVNFDEDFEKISQQLHELLAQPQNKRMSKLPIGAIISFQYAGYDRVTATIRKIDDEGIHFNDVVYDDGEEFDNELILSINSLRGIKIIKMEG